MGAEAGGGSTGRQTTSATRLLCVLGHPVRHSLSPALHSAALLAAGVDAVYLAFDVAPEAFDDAIAGLRSIGFLGANVTIPHKAAALESADTATDEAVLIGAANTLFWRDDVLVADNTDAVGLIGVLATGCGVGEGTPVTIVGAGGAARAAAVAAGRLGAAVSVHARSDGPAGAVADLAVRAGGATPDGAGRPTVVVNATPLGRHGEALPPAFMGLGPGRVALDLNYGAPSPFLSSAVGAGGRAIDGLGMLVAQAEASFERWTGQRPPPGAMRAAAGAS